MTSAALSARFGAVGDNNFKVAFALLTTLVINGIISLVLRGFGAVTPPADGSVWDACEMLRDVRSLLSFLAGGAVCFLVLSLEEDDEDAVDEPDGSQREVSTTGREAWQLLASI
eukprot:TRINITY_DN5495_c0_g6_i1.p1 TRINITY_DN5495_c0_g6~~TRINITY_DN5495_c0_g6_i1.p1  ORF type:complete len:114 (-),score=24.11 TRINITY_DN5495_c0_g6_i1:93-434(-)